MKSFKGAFLINIFPIANSALKNLHRQTKNLVYNTFNCFIEVKQSSIVPEKLMQVIAYFMDIMTTKKTTLTLGE